MLANRLFEKVFRSFFSKAFGCEEKGYGEKKYLNSHTRLNHPVPPRELLGVEVPVLFVLTFLDLNT